MRAVLLVGHGGLEKLEYREDVPTPEPAEGEVLISVGAAGMNNTDIGPEKVSTERKTIRRAQAAGVGGIRCGSREYRVLTSSTKPAPWAPST